MNPVQVCEKCLKEIQKFKVDCSRFQKKCSVLYRYKKTPLKAIQKFKVDNSRFKKEVCVRECIRVLGRSLQNPEEKGSPASREDILVSASLSLLVSSLTVSSRLDTVASISLHRGQIIIIQYSDDKVANTWLNTCQLTI